MKITKEQMRELSYIATEIRREHEEDDDALGFVPEPYNSWMKRIYAVVNEVDRSDRIERKKLHNMFMKTCKDFADELTGKTSSK